MPRKILALLSVIVLILLCAFSASADEVDRDHLKKLYDSAVETEKTISWGEAKKKYAELVGYWEALDEGSTGRDYGDSKDFYRYAQGRLDFDAGRYLNAYENFAWLMIIKQYTDEQFYLLSFYYNFTQGVSLLESGDPEKAFSSFSDALKINSKADQLCTSKMEECVAKLEVKIDQACERGEYQEARRLCNIIKVPFPSRGDTLLSRVNAHEAGRVQPTPTVDPEAEFKAFCTEAAGGRHINYIMRNTYRFIYNRDKEAGKEWAKSIAMDNPTGADLARKLVELPCFAYSGLSNAQKVDIIYEVLLNNNQAYRENNRARHIEYLDAGTSVYPVLREVVASPQFLELCKGESLNPGAITIEESVRDTNPNVTRFVYHCYKAALNRGPENTDVVDNYCRILLNHEKSFEDILFIFVQAAGIERPNMSDEEYVRMLYRTILGREMDDIKEVPGRVDQLRTGSISREAQALGIIGSPECANYLDKYRLTEEDRSRLGGKSRLEIYNEATDLMNGGDHKGACQKFKSISGFLDSDVLADQCGTEAFYKEAIKPRGNIDPPDWVRRTYEAIYHMFGIEESERLEWANSMLGWGSIAAAVESFISYPTFNDPRISNAERVKALYSIMLGRVVDPSDDGNEGSYFRRYLDVGMSARAVAYAICQGDEYNAFTGGTGGVVQITEARDYNYQLTAIISRCYQAGLHWPAGAEEINYWCSVYGTSEQRIVTVVSSLLCGDEATRNLNNENFVKVLYWIAMNQDPGEEKIREWVGQLNGGVVSRWDVAAAVLQSPPAVAYLSSLGLQGPW